MLLAGMLVLLVAGFALLFPSAVHAQCGEPPVSTCRTCHQQGLTGEWHAIHASKDLCLNCHGGNGTVMTASLAHEGMTAYPLSDVYTDCHSCHPDDYVVRAQRFASTLGEPIGSCATPTPAPAASVSYHPLVVQAAPVSEARRTPSTSSLIFGATLLVFGFGLAVTLILRRL
jgi:hypothetical protein